MAELGLGDNQPNASVKVNEIMSGVRRSEEDDLILGQIKEGALGSDLFTEA